MFNDQKDIETILGAFGEQLDGLAGEHVELLVCGGSALIAMGLVQRTTKDVDVLAYVKRTEEGNVSFIKAQPFSNELLTASAKVARDFNLPENWVNPGPASAVDLGLPEGIMERVTSKNFGRKLTIHFLGRIDQIHFKLYASVDQGAGKHFDDLLALNPTEEELEQSARWSMTHDVSEGYRQVLKDLLNHLGFKDVTKRL
ncbi:MAG: hypothetical protein JRJ02_11265 [Deltaproteobacteria bacterium]|nr:hypothetical protein [Deltaproteobacteria bacterium]